jgi:hypothetical protein
VHGFLAVATQRQVRHTAKKKFSSTKVFSPPATLTNIDKEVPDTQRCDVMKQWDGSYIHHFEGECTVNGWGELEGITRKLILARIWEFINTVLTPDESVNNIPVTGDRRSKYQEIM